MSAARTASSIASRRCAVLPALAGMALCAACASVPQERSREAAAPVGPAPAPVATSVTPPAVATLESTYRARAEALSRDGRWADAAVQWDLLALLRPDVADYASSAADARRRMTDAAAERVRAGNEARQRGDLDLATTQFLRALAADPTDARAADALREIERERVRRTYLNRGARSGMATSPFTPPALQSPPPQPPAPRGLSRQPTPAALSDVDAGVMLFRQGDFLGAIQALQRHLQVDRTDEMARGYLADACVQQGSRYAQEGRREDALFYYERAHAAGYRDRQTVQALIRSTRQALGDEYFRLGVQAAATDPKRAVFLWERSLVYDPQHAQAAVRLRQARPTVPLATTSASSPSSGAAKPAP